jgi:hypothetical protein
MVFNATFSNISAISWRSVLLVEETGVPMQGLWKILTSLSYYIFHVFSPVVSCQLRCSVRSSLLPVAVFLCNALSVISDDFLKQLFNTSLIANDVRVVYQ